MLETPGKQGNNAPHELHLDGISRIWGCAHANKLSPPSLHLLPHLCHPQVSLPAPPHLSRTLHLLFPLSFYHGVLELRIAFGAKIFRALSLSLSVTEKTHHITCLKHTFATNTGQVYQIFKNVEKIEFLVGLILLIVKIYNFINV